MIRKHIVFTGQVQDVGFRWRARQAAKLYGCTGWCRNEWDGSVTMEIQGSENAIDISSYSISSRMETCAGQGLFACRRRMKTSTALRAPGPRPGRISHGINYR